MCLDVVVARIDIIPDDKRGVIDHVIGGKGAVNRQTAYFRGGGRDGYFDQLAVGQFAVGSDKPNRIYSDQTIGYIPIE